MSSNLDRYERIAPLYNLLDLPFEYSRYRKLRPLLFQGLKGRVYDAGHWNWSKYSILPTWGPGRRHRH